MQVRSGDLTRGVLNNIEAHVHRVLNEIEGAWGYIAILEEGAVVPSPEVRRRQRSLLAECFEVADIRLAVVIAGRGVGAMLLRSVARMAMPGHRSVRVMSEASDAVRWISDHVSSPSARELEELIARLRRFPSQPAAGWR